MPVHLHFMLSSPNMPLAYAYNKAPNAIVITKTITVPKMLDSALLLNILGLVCSSSFAFVSIYYKVKIEEILKLTS